MRAGEVAAAIGDDPVVAGSATLLLLLSGLSPALLSSGVPTRMAPPNVPPFDWNTLLVIGCCWRRR